MSSLRVEVATCTLCVNTDEYVAGFYNGCMVNDGVCDDGWKCDGKGNLTRVIDVPDIVYPRVVGPEEVRDEGEKPES